MIAHIDADAFFASVLQRLHPHLKGKPLLALGMGGGCVIAASYEAKAKGVKTGMPLKEALALCPEALSMPSDFAETGLASAQLQGLMEDICPTIEQYSIDEWFLDLSSIVGGVPFDLLLWASDTQAAIARATDLMVSIGIAPSKTLAKMASEERKPAGITVIEPHEIEAFLTRRPAAAIPGIGRRRCEHAKIHRWETAWDIAMADSLTIERLFGKPGLDLQRELQGERLSRVCEDDRPPQSISRCRSFRRTNEHTIIWGTLLEHVSYTVLKMRRQHLTCRGISVWLRDDSYRHHGATLKLPQPMDTEEGITPFITAAFERIFDRSRRYTQAGCCLWNIGARGAVQHSLFESPNALLQEEKLQQSLDSLRTRFGREVVIRGSQLPVTKKRKRPFVLPFLS